MPVPRARLYQESGVTPGLGLLQATLSSLVLCLALGRVLTLLPNWSLSQLAYPLWATLCAFAAGWGIGVAVRHGHVRRSWIRVLLAFASGWVLVYAAWFFHLQDLLGLRSFAPQELLPALWQELIDPRRVLLGGSPGPWLRSLLALAEAGLLVGGTTLMGWLSNHGVPYSEELGGWAEIHTELTLAAPEDLAQWRDEVLEDPGKLLALEPWDPENELYLQALLRTVRGHPREQAFLTLVAGRHSGKGHPSLARASSPLFFNLVIGPELTEHLLACLDGPGEVPDGGSGCTPPPPFGTVDP